MTQEQIEKYNEITHRLSLLNCLLIGLDGKDFYRNVPLHREDDKVVRDYVIKTIEKLNKEIELL